VRDSWKGNGKRPLEPVPHPQVAQLIAGLMIQRIAGWNPVCASYSRWNWLNPHRSIGQRYRSSQQRAGPVFSSYQTSFVFDVRPDRSNRRRIAWRSMNARIIRDS